MTHEPIHSPLAPAVVEMLRRLKHDLGKYVAMQQRWLGPDPSPAALREALANDLLRTRRGPDGEVDAAQVWQGFRSALTGETPLDDGSHLDLRGDPMFQAIDAAMHVIRSELQWLRTEQSDASRVQRLHEAAMEVAQGCRDLVRAATDPSRTPWPKS